jgi:hypothetical protein
MLKRKPIIIVLALAIVLALGATACTPEELQALQGTLKNVDSVSGNVTVTLDDGTTRNFNFKDVNIETVRQALGTASLTIGDNITLRANREGEVRKLQVKSAEAGGIINAIGADSITISTTNKKGDLTVKVTGQTVIRMGGRAEDAKADKGAGATLADLKTGYRAEVRYDVTTGEALRINVNTGIVNSQGKARAGDNGQPQNGRDRQQPKGRKDS